MAALYRIRDGLSAVVPACVTPAPMPRCWPLPPSGELVTKDGILKQTNRLLAQAQPTQEMLSQLYTEYLALPALFDVVFPSEIDPNKTLAASMQTELLSLVNRIALQEEGDLRTLFSTQHDLGRCQSGAFLWVACSPRVTPFSARCCRRRPSRRDPHHRRADGAQQSTESNLAYVAGALRSRTPAVRHDSAASAEHTAHRRQQQHGYTDAAREARSASQESRVLGLSSDDGSLWAWGWKTSIASAASDDRRHGTRHRRCGRPRWHDVPWRTRARLASGSRSAGDELPGDAALPLRIGADSRPPKSESFSSRSTRASATEATS